MEGNFGSLSFQHGSRPDYPVNDKKANSDDLPITRISKCAEEGYLTLNIVWVHLSSYKSKRYIKYTVV